MSFLFAIREIFTGNPRKWLDFFVIQKKSNTFATAYKKTLGALVQLVRMPACHAGGHGFESRTHRGDKCKRVLKP